MHIPVLLNKVLEILNPKKNENFIDATFGEGNVSLEIVKLIYPQGRVLAFEWDPDLYQLGQQKIKTMKVEKRIKLVNKNFKEIEKVVKKEKFFQIKGVVFDLGISSWHYEKSGRGFSFKDEKSLDMRINFREIKTTASEIINNLSYHQLISIFKVYGEEKEAEKIVQAITQRRKIKKITNARELADLVKQVKRTKGKIHPATKVFMALRIFINQELENLEKGLLGAYNVLESGGKLVVISFHGLENLVIKRVFKKLKKEKGAEMITKKTIKPSREEILKNPKSRSAILRSLKKP